MCKPVAQERIFSKTSGISEFRSKPNPRQINKLLSRSKFTSWSNFSEHTSKITIKLMIKTVLNSLCSFDKKWFIRQKMVHSTKKWFIRQKMVFSKKSVDFLEKSIRSYPKALTFAHLCNDFSMQTYFYCQILIRFTILD